ncbi:hypothetical protein LCGC14_1218480 [marine sediment metagenome]|uniref:Uncharacterized protein n=1 Tax=marine sediment metagenome TaxID=412755 RepID=A0A0F9PGI7_9ZZZZ
MEIVKYDNTDWNEVPSVTCGGKNCFYVTHNDNGKFTILWNRRDKRWEIVKEVVNGGEIVASYFRAPQQAMKYFNEVLGF